MWDLPWHVPCYGMWQRHVSVAWVNSPELLQDPNQGHDCIPLLVWNSFLCSKVEEDSCVENELWS